MQRREIWILVLVVVLIGAIWTVHTLLDQEMMTDTAPVERSDQQNSGTNAPSEQVPAAGTTGAQTNP
ncbi:hypothetical protein JYU29_06795 [Tianweitania sp. BSSL-BM11]|uniref:Uncharacterized protein n=1 Tax=Tianweitania aestuarii TaxID=2814886 RepID=A0ABS5RW21_9HYPH|nr:hypothetical protein [Tianweitania aestuarii]MBS9720389.1 hypothetical protein [Tianweitania aestuarii]